MTLLVSKQWFYARALPFLLIVFPVFIDMLQGAMGSAGRAGLLSVGVLFRGLIAVLAIYLLLKLRGSPLRSFLMLFLAIFLFSNIVWSLSSDFYSFPYEFSQAMKVAFPWLLAGIFLYLDRQAQIEPHYLMSLIAWAGFVSALSILAGAAFGVGHQTYGDWSYGTKGLFNAQNDIGLVLVMTMAAAIVMFARARQATYLIVPGVIAIAGILLGTRTGVMGPAMVIVGFFFATLLNRRMLSPKGGAKALASTVAVLVLPVLLIAGVGTAIYTQVDKTQFIIKKIENLSEDTPRSKLETAGAERLRDRNLALTLFGEGGLSFIRHVAENLGRPHVRYDSAGTFSRASKKNEQFSTHRVENDIFDVLGFYGITQFIVLYGGLLIVYALTLRMTFRAWNMENVGFLLIFTLFLGHSSLAGHGIFSPQVTTLIAPIIFLQHRDYRWKPFHWSAAKTVVNDRTITRTPRA